MKKYYDILEINSESSIDQIKQAYRKLAKKFHPDLNKSPDAAKKFIEINEAYEMLIYIKSKKSTYTPKNKEEIYYEFVKKVKEEAQRRAKMKYEKFQREHEAFRESGLYDLGLILKYSGLIVLPFFASFLVVFPIYYAIKIREPFTLIPLAFFILVGGVLWYDIIQRRKSFFKLGKFYYTWEKIKKNIFENSQIYSNECFYCKGYPANSKPFKFTIIHVKSVKLQNNGPMQHMVGYDRTEEKISIPRSRKAYFVHFFSSCTKLFAILGFLLFSPIDSIIWRLIGGLFTGWILSFLILFFTNTKSKVGYLFSPIFVLKIILWLVFIIALSKFHISPLIISTSEFLPVYFFVMFLLDSVLEQLLKMQKYNWYRPFLKPYKTLKYFTNNNYLYLEIPFWTVIYPIIRWIF